MNQANIGSYIARKRREKNLTQEQLAERLGVSNKTISKWENGKCMPNYSVIEQELNGLSDVVVYAPSLSDGHDDCGKIVVRQHHVRHVFRYVRSCDAHADTNIGGFNGRRVVYAVARHRGNGSASLPRLDDPRFVLRLNAGVHAVFRNLLAKLLIRKPVQIGAGHRLGLVEIGRASCRERVSDLV